MTWVLVLRLLMLTPDSDVEALQRTAPEPISFDVAAENLVAARLFAWVFGVDADLLLSIAAHETRYQANAVGPESGGRVSCGVMQTTPRASCPPHMTTLEGYLEGAKHLRGWIDATRDLDTALLGYAGGYRGIKACANGPVLRKTGAHDDLCLVARVFKWRRDWIRRERRTRSSEKLRS